ncbi:GMC family oxidoreductase [Archangium sp.]|uniref:GMC family oxidoreductase n=1 Tax=Archangium sp. TaxID=1872627 RepID=UPI002D406D57|nr:GMC family oxidoreductase [Archangium sp.]HYO55757.1 GMC family oxidoreductase [Archangium sp.]
MSMKTQFDMVIIGSGAGGAPIAHELVLAGKSVLVLEKGPLLRYQHEHPRGLSDFKRDEFFATGAEKRLQLEVSNKGRSYYSSHIEPDLNDEPHIYRTADGRDEATIEGYTAQVVGGGTHLYGGVSLRYSPLDFRLRSYNEGRASRLRDDPNGEVVREARDWPITYEQLEPYYCKGERLVGINGTREGQAKMFSADHYQKPLAANPISRYVERGMDALGMCRYRTPLAVITEDHAPSGRKAHDSRTAFVNRYGDPLGLKSSTWACLLGPISRRENFELRANCIVTHLECQNGRVHRVHYRDPGGEPRTVEGKLVVVACSAIESVRLLMLSAEQDEEFRRRIHDSGLLGRYFLTHCFGGAELRLAEDEERYDKSISLDSDWATDFCTNSDFLDEHGLWAGGALYNNTSDQALPLSLARTHRSSDLDTTWDGFLNDVGLTGEGLVDFIRRDFGKRLSMSYMANQVPMRDNRIELHPSVRDKWGRKVAYILKGWHSHDRVVMQVLANQCRAVLERSGARYDQLDWGSADGVNRIANHILGGARFGTDPKDSVLDPDCRAWQLDNLYLTDGSFMPTAGGANPTLTIQANAFRVADHLKERV